MKMADRIIRSQLDGLTDLTSKLIKCWYVAVHKNNNTLMVVLHWYIYPGVYFEDKLRTRLSSYLHIPVKTVLHWHPSIKGRSLYYFIRGELGASSEMQYANLWKQIKEKKTEVN
jgi:hypothetical protein